MNHTEIMRARDEFLECLALHGDCLIISAADLSINNSGAKPVYNLFVAITPRMIGSVSQDGYPKLDQNMAYVLRLKRSNLWDALDAEIAMALKAAVKFFVEASDSTRRAGFFETYNLGHAIEFTEQSQSDRISKISPVVSAIKSLSVLDKKDSDLLKSEKALLARRVSKAIEKCGFSVNHEWENQHIPPVLSNWFDTAEEKLANGEKPEMIKKSFSRYIYGLDLNLFDNYKINHYKSGRTA